MTPQTSTAPRRTLALFMAVGLAAGLSLAACGDDDGASDTATEATTETTVGTEDGEGGGSGEPAEEGISVTGAWARTSPMEVTAGAAYMQIENVGPADDALVGASVPATVAGRTEVHETRAVGEGAPDEGMGEEGGAMGDEEPPSAPMMEMVPVDRVEVPAGEVLSLEPGGYHVMMFDLVEPLVAGDELEITLTFEAAGDVVVTAVVGDGAP